MYNITHDTNINLKRNSSNKQLDTLVAKYLTHIIPKMKRQTNNWNGWNHEHKSHGKYTQNRQIGANVKGAIQIPKWLIYDCNRLCYLEQSLWKQDFGFFLFSRKFTDPYIELNAHELAMDFNFFLFFMSVNIAAIIDKRVMTIWSFEIMKFVWVVCSSLIHSKIYNFSIY